MSVAVINVHILGLTHQLMRIVANLKTRLSARADSEHEQALIRIVIVGLVLAYMALFHGLPGSWNSADVSILLGLVGFFAIAVAIFVAICIFPGQNKTRRLIGMMADAGGATWYMCVSGEYGFSMVGLYLFITFGNGFRYGRQYLFGCQALSLLGCIVALLTVPYWQVHRPAGIGMVLALVVLPLYVSTLLKRIQAERARAEEANQAKTTFLANMSHEMRTPLNGIVGVVDLFKTTQLSEQQSELVRLLRHSMTVLRSLVDDVLDISKIEAGHLTIEVVPFDLHASINSLIQLLRPHAQAKGLTLRASIDPAVDYKLRGDPHHLRQILLNLLGNALKFTEHGEVALTVALVKETPDGVTARFEVVDSGIGIAPDALPQIFERFVQADQSTTRKYGGTGLGTTIAKQLVELMGGNIGVTSVLGQGSTFWFEIPVLRDTVAEPEIQSTPRHDAREVSLLVADGDAAASIGAMLRSAGEAFEVLTPMVSVWARIDALTSEGKILRGIVAAGAVDTACVAFTAALQRAGDRATALIYVARAPVSVVDNARLKSIRDVCVLPPGASPKLLENAIHAAIAGGGRESADIVDLSQVLRKQRRKLTILVADDNATNQTIISKLLVNAGHTVILASNGEEALDVYERDMPDMAILDYNMPGRTGVEVVQAIRLLEPPGTRMPAMILSASVTVEARERASQAGADEFVSKPFDAVVLLEKIDALGNQILRLRSTERKPTAPTASVTNLASARGGRREVAGSTDLVDSARLSELEDIARDSRFMAELLRGFRSDVEGILTKVDLSIANADFAALPDLMHTLKGAAVGVGARQLANLSEEMDRAAEDGGSMLIKARAQEIRTSFNSTIVFLNDYVVREHKVSL